MGQGSTRGIFAIVLAATVFVSAGVVRAGEKEARDGLGRIPGFPGVKSMVKLPGGLWEVAVNGGGVAYITDDGSLALKGEVFSTKDGKNITKETLDKLSKDDWKELPFDAGIKETRGGGKRKMALVTDANCGYCKRIEGELSAIDNVEIWRFPVAYLGEDSARKAAALMSSKAPLAAYKSWMLNGVEPKGSTPAAAEKVARSTEFFKRRGVTGTPFVLFEDGRRISGAVPLKEIEAGLDAKPR